jgi:hypothetical protein
MEFKKYPKINQVGHEDCKDIFSDSEDFLVIEEKIDGGQFNFFIKDNKIYFGTHNKPIGEKVEEFDKNWKRVAEHIVKQISLRNDLSVFENHIFYGEACLKHTIDYNWERIPPFLGYDVWSIKEDKFIDMGLARYYYEQLNLSFVPVINECQVKDLSKFLESCSNGL